MLPINREPQREQQREERKTLERKWRERREQPGANAQCPPRLMRAHAFELSTEVFHFYGSIEVLRKSYISTEQRRLIPRKS